MEMEREMKTEPRMFTDIALSEEMKKSNFLIDAGHYTVVVSPYIEADSVIGDKNGLHMTLIEFLQIVCDCGAIHGGDTSADQYHTCDSTYREFMEGQVNIWKSWDSVVNVILGFDGRKSEMALESFLYEKFKFIDHQVMIRGIEVSISDLRIFVIFRERDEDDKGGRINLLKRYLSEN